MVRVRERTAREELQNELKANPINPHLNVGRQEEILLSRMRVALQDGEFTPETKKSLGENFDGAVRVALKTRSIQDVPLKTLFHALRVITADAGLPNEGLTLVKQPGGFLRSEKLVATFSSEDAANKIKTFATNPALLERSLA